MSRQKAALLWVLFSSTASIAAVLVPVHIIFGNNPPFLPSFLAPVFFALFYFSTVFHGSYRLKTILEDLGRNEALATGVAGMLFLLLAGWGVVVMVRLLSW